MASYLPSPLIALRVEVINVSETQDGNKIWPVILLQLTWIKFVSCVTLVFTE